MSSALSDGLKLVNFVDKAVTLTEKLKRLTNVLETAVEDNTNGDFF